MKNFIYTLFLLLAFLFAPIIASAGNAELIQEEYGIIDDIDIEESEVIINDRLFLYTDESFLQNSSGRNIANLNKLRVKSYVKYSFIEKQERSLLVDLKTISKFSYESARAKQQIIGY